MRQSGFTLVELIVVMVIIGLLAVTALPRFFERDTFDSRGFKDETVAALRYAQKVAIAQRRTVCVTFTASSLTLSIVPGEGSSNCAAAVNLTGPSGSSPYQITPKSAGVGYAPVPSDFHFKPLGSASSGQSIQISGATGSIVIEQETGYVRE